MPNKCILIREKPGMEKKKKTHMCPVIRRETANDFTYLTRPIAGRLRKATEIISAQNKLSL